MLFNRYWNHAPHREIDLNSSVIRFLVDWYRLLLGKVDEFKKIK